MSIVLTINGNNYPFPNPLDENWGQNVTDWATAVTNGMLQKAGGNFTLLSDLNFGSSFGIISKYYKSNSVNIASTGQIRLAYEDSIVFRNYNNTSDLSLFVNFDHLNFNGSNLANFSDLAGKAPILNDSGTNLSLIKNSAASTLRTLVEGPNITLQESVDGEHITISAAAAPDLSNNNPNSVGITSAGVSDEASRSDHVHNHGNQSGGSEHSQVTTSVDGFMSATDKVKLDGVASGATANQTDAYLLDRANHTGTQSASTITGLAAVATSGLKADVGLVNVDNTSDLNKPVSTATQNELDLKVDKTQTVNGHALSGNINVTKSDLSLSNVDNTSDVNKPVSTATQDELDLKAPLDSPALTGNPTAPTQSSLDNSTKIATTAYVDAKVSVITPARVVTLDNITLSGTQTIDSVSLSIGDRVLVTNQTTSSQNGMYIVAAGAWSRSTDFNTAVKLTPGIIIPVSNEGPLAGSTGWIINYIVTTLGTDPVTITKIIGKIRRYVYFNVAGSYTSWTPNFTGFVDVIGRAGAGAGAGGFGGSGGGAGGKPGASATTGAGGGSSGAGGGGGANGLSMRLLKYEQVPVTAGVTPTIVVGTGGIGTSAGNGGTGAVTNTTNGSTGVSGGIGSTGVTGSFGTRSSFGSLVFQANNVASGSGTGPGVGLGGASNGTGGVASTGGNAGAVTIPTLGSLCPQYGDRVSLGFSANILGGANHGAGGAGGAGGNNTTGGTGGTRTVSSLTPVSYLDYDSNLSPVPNTSPTVHTPTGSSGGTGGVTGGGGGGGGSTSRSMPGAGGCATLPRGYFIIPDASGGVGASISNSSTGWSQGGTGGNGGPTGSAGSAGSSASASISTADPDIIAATPGINGAGGGGGCGGNGGGGGGGGGADSTNPTSGYNGGAGGNGSKGSSGAPGSDGCILVMWWE